MSPLVLIVADLAAAAILVFALYFPRYRRRDMVVAILSVNVGVMAVANALAAAEVSAGLGLGLFGVLSIIRLRSDEIAQSEIAYYFSALALGLLAGFQLDPVWLSPVLMGAVLVALYVGDHPALLPNHRQQTITLDRAYPDEAELRARLKTLLAADVSKVTVKKLDLVNDTTSVDVRYRLGRGASPTPSADEQRVAARSWS